MFAAKVQHSKVWVKKCVHFVHFFIHCSCFLSRALRVSTDNDFLCFMFQNVVVMY